MARHRFAMLVLAALLVVTACGQSGASSAATGGSSSPSPETSVEPAASPSSEGGSSAEPAASASASAAASGDISAGGTCHLMTVEEVAGIVGTAVVAVAPDPSSCVYEIPVTHAIIALTQVVSNAAAATYANFKGNPEAKAVTGLGDDAVWLPAYGAVNVHVLKGDKMLSLAVGTLSGVPIDALPSDISPQQLLDMATKLGAIAVPRV
jgi:hypothetical protein